MKQIVLLITLLLASNLTFAQREVFVKSDAAIRGYDPVAYFTQGMPVQGKKEWSYVWKDATWFFSNQENMNTFRQQPEKYAPQFGGYCAYGVMEGHKASTQPNAWTIIGGKLYLNYNTDVRARWKKDQQQNIDTAKKNWPAVKLERD
jgi:YHS domain-containing protein